MLATHDRRRFLSRDRAALRELTSFGAVGAVNTYVDLAVFNLLVGTLHEVAANLGGYITGMVVGWWLNRCYTFGSTGNRPLGLGVYAAVNALGIAATSAAVMAAGLVVPGDLLMLNVMKVGAGVAVMVLKFGILRRWVAAA